MAEVATAAGLAFREAPTGRLSRARASPSPTTRRRAGNSPTSPELDLDCLRGDDAERRDQRRRGRDRPLARRGARAPTPSCSSEQLGSLVPVEDPFVARNEAAWSDGVLVHVPRGVKLERADPDRDPARRRRRRGQLAHPDRARGGRRGRGLGALVLARRRDRRAAQLGGRAHRRPGRHPALRQHPGHLREVVDLRHPARPGRARRPPRLGRARLRLRRRQGADGDQARRPGLGGAGHRRLRRRPRPAPRLRHDSRSTRRRTPTPTSPSAASSPPARPRSGAG